MCKQAADIFGGTAVPSRALIGSNAAACNSGCLSCCRWSKGALEEASEGLGSGAPALTCLSSQSARLAANTRAHLEGLPAEHVLLYGPSGSGKSWLLWEAALAAGAERGVRLVEVPPSELPNILDIARGCARYPRVRFILVADHVDFPLPRSAAADLCSGLSGGSGPSGWPDNTLLYMAASASSTITASDGVVGRFGLPLGTGNLTAEEFVAAVKELALAGLVAKGSAAEGGDAAEQLQPAAEAALQWAESSQAGLTVRAAAMAARRMRQKTAGSPVGGEQ